MRSMSKHSKRKPNNNTTKRSWENMNKSDSQIDSFEDLVSRMQCMFDSMNAKIEEKIDASVEQLKSQIADLRDEVQNLKDECGRDIFNLAESVSQVRNDVSINRGCIERAARANELLLTGVPYDPEECLPDVVQKLSTVLGYQAVPLVQPKRLARSPIVTGSTPPILLQFAFNISRNEFYSRYLATRNLSLVHLGFNVNTRIYINENLSEDARKIRGAAIKLKKSGKLHNVFTRDGIVYIKLREGAAAVPIQAMEHLHSSINPSS